MVVLSYRSLYNSMNLFESPDSRRIITDVTRILNAIEQGDAHVADKLFLLVYEEPRLLAAQKML